MKNDPSRSDLVVSAIIHPGRKALTHPAQKIIIAVFLALMMLATLNVLFS